MGHNLNGPWFNYQLPRTLTGSLLGLFLGRLIWLDPFGRQAASFGWTHLGCISAAPFGPPHLAGPPLGRISAGPFSAASFGWTHLCRISAGLFWSFVWARLGRILALFAALRLDW